MARIPPRRAAQADLAALANRWEPEASSSPPAYRRATCVVCARPMTRMHHLWLKDGGFKKELHACSSCGRALGFDETLIVVAAFDHDYDANLDTFTGGEVVRVDTSEGGHPTGAYLRAYREHPDHSSYLFLQDSMRGIAGDVVAPLREREEEVVAWCSFGLFFDNPEQEAWVRRQYPDLETPERGIFGPVFYATRDALEQAEPWFPEVPANRNQAQATERAWAFAFAAAGIDVGWLHEFNPYAMGAGECPPFTKHFAGRP